MMLMQELLTNLAISLPDWSIPWAGIGGFLLGLGGTLSGIAALKTARNRGRDESCTSTSSGPGDDRGSGVSDSESSGPE
jgi:hypothetical protein